MGVVILETLRIPPDDFAYNARLAPIAHVRKTSRKLVVKLILTIVKISRVPLLFQQHAHRVVESSESTIIRGDMKLREGLGSE